MNAANTVADNRPFAGPASMIAGLPHKGVVPTVVPPGRGVGTMVPPDPEKPNKHGFVEPVARMPGGGPLAAGAC